MDPADPLYNPVEYDSGTRYHLDLDDGTVYQFNDEGEWVAIGAIPGTGGGDGSAPSQVLNLVLTPLVTFEDDGATIHSVALQAEWDANPESDIIGYEIQLDPYDDLFAVYVTAWTGGTQIVFDDLIAGHEYWCRVRAYDTEGFTGPWSDIVSEVTLDDGTAPAIPSDVIAIPGYKLIAVQWTLGSEADLDHYEVQWTGELAGVPDVANAQIITTDATQVIVVGLGVGLPYYARVRAVDASGLVQTSASDPTGVMADISPDAGWSDWTDPCTTLLVGSSDLAVHALAAEFVNTGVLNANRTNTGTLTLGKTTAPGGTPTGIVVYDSLGRFIGWWDQTGMLMVNPVVPKEAMWLNAGKLQFTNVFAGYASAPDPPPASALAATVWQTAITPLGINAEAITFGSSQAGHNLVPNSGFELQAFSTTAESGVTITSAADWAAGTGRINLDVSTVDLKLTAL
jgi:hypothetical protein